VPDPVLLGFEILATLAGVAYVVLAARRNRLCWIAGASSSALVALLSGLSGLPMQAGLNVFYVLMALYGWWAWTRSAGEGELPVGVWPLGAHIGVALALLAVTWLSARVLATETRAAWPRLDSLTTWFSLFATWLTARAKIENWLYWVFIDGVLVFLYYVQDHPLVALLNVLYVVIAVGGFISWRRRFQAQAVPT
jgi:nicotinamide mononucleotide transporter